MFTDWISIVSSFTFKDLINLIIGSILTGGAFWIALQAIVQKTIDYKVAQKIQEHKTKLDIQLEAYKNALQHDMKLHEQKLQVMTEGAKSEYSKQLQDFGIYNTKRHETYALLFALFIQSFQQTCTIGDIKSTCYFKRYSVNKLQKLLEELEAEESVIKKYLTDWDREKNNQEFLEILYQEVKSLKIKMADKILITTHNQFLKSTFYISESVENQMWEIHGQLRIMISEKLDNESHGNSDIFIRLKTKTDSDLKNLKDMLKRELSRGDYKESLPKTN